MRDMIDVAALKKKGLKIVFGKNGPYLAPEEVIKKVSIPEPYCLMEDDLLAELKTIAGKHLGR